MPYPEAAGTDSSILSLGTINGGHVYVILARVRPTPTPQLLEKRLRCKGTELSRTYRCSGQLVDGPSTMR